MMGQLTPLPHHYDRLTTAFLDAYDVASLVQLARFTLEGFRQNDFDTSTMTKFLNGLFDWMDQRRTWITFLTRAKGDRKTNRTFVVICEEVLNHLRTEVASDGMSDPLKSVLLARRQPFVDRESIRDAIVDMDREDGWGSLVLAGPEHVGKTYCFHYLLFLCKKKWANNRLAWVILSEKIGYEMGPSALAQHLGVQILGRDEALPRPQPGSKENLWASYLATWLATQADRTGSRIWVFLDGFDHPDVPPETHVFIATLVAEASNRSTLRVILPGYARYREVVPEYARGSVKCETLTFLSAEQIQHFFDELDNQRRFRAHPRYIADGKPADAFVEGYRLLPAERQDQRIEAVREALPGVVQRLFEITSLAGNAP